MRPMIPVPGQHPVTILDVRGKPREVVAIDRRAWPCLPIDLFFRDPPRVDYGGRPIVVVSGPDEALAVLRRAGFPIEDRRGVDPEATGAAHT